MAPSAAFAQPYRRRRAAPPVMPAERWLFVHPSWLRWWVLPNLEAAAGVNRRPITGVLCVFAKGEHTDTRHYAEVRRRCNALGLQFAYGIRHSHQVLDDWRLPLDVAWQRAAVERLAATHEPNLILDLEPYYYKSRRYHGTDDAAGIAAATEPWAALGTRNVYVYPVDFAHPRSIMAQARRGGANVFALDHHTYRAGRYDDLAAFMAKRAALATRDGYHYVPGFFLYYLTDAAVMKAAGRYGRCWFFPRCTKGHPDDLPHFGTDKWRPKEP